MAHCEADGAGRDRRGTCLRTAAWALAALLAPASCSSATHAQLLTGIGAEAGTQTGDGESIAVHRDWARHCEMKADAKNPSCKVSTLATGTDAKNNAVSITLSGERLPTGAPLFHFVLPLDLLVANGVEMRFSTGATLRLAYRSCHATGCIVPFRLSQELETRFRKDLDFTLRAFNLDGSSIDIRVPLAGFAAAFAGS